MNQFNNMDPIKLDPITIKLIENRSFKNWNEYSILKINQLIGDFAHTVDESQFANILIITNQYSANDALKISREIYTLLEETPTKTPKEVDSEESTMYQTLSGLTDTIRGWGIQSRFKKACDTVTEQATKVSETVSGAAKSKSIEFVKKHGATITVTLLCRRFGLSPEVAKEIINLFKD